MRNKANGFISVVVDSAETNNVVNKKSVRSSADGFISVVVTGTETNKVANNKSIRSSADGFTLIELLVVVAIIAVLVAILLPALGMAREIARSSVCLSNQKQIAIGIQIYSVDYNDYLAPCSTNSQYSPYVMAYIPGVTANPPYIFNIGHLYQLKYIREPKISYCPSMQKPMFRFNTLQNPWWENPCPGGTSTLTKSSYYYWTRAPFHHFSDPRNETYRRSSDVGDKAIMSDNFYDPSQYAHKTRKGFNVLYGDGSARLWVDGDGYFEELARIVAQRSWPDLTIAEIYEIFEKFDHNN